MSATTKQAKERRAMLDARRAMAGVRASDVERAKELEATSPDVLAALVAGVVGMCEASQDDGDVMAYAAGVVARLWCDRRDESVPVPAVVAYAVRLARRTLALAKWDDVYGDMTDAAVITTATYRNGDERTTLGHYGTAPADAKWQTTYRDLLDACVESVPVLAAGRRSEDEAGPRATLVRLARLWSSHRVSGCCAGAGAPVTLRGIEAHALGLVSTDSGYSRAWRRAVRVQGLVDRAGVLDEYGSPDARPTYGRNGVYVGQGSPGHKAPAVLAGSPGRSLPAVLVARAEWVTVDYVWRGSHDFRVRAWTGERVESVPGHAARRNGWRMADVNGYPASLGYGAPATTASGSWCAVREERATTRLLPAVEVPARPAVPGPAVLVVARRFDENGYAASLGYGDAGEPVNVAMRALTDDERALCGSPDAKRAETVYGLDEGSPDARPDDEPLRGERTAAGVLRSFKPVVSSRKRVGANTGPTVPVRLVRK